VGHTVTYYSFHDEMAFVYFGVCVCVCVFVTLGGGKSETEYEGTKR
jgi:hypothetical protein